MEANLNLNKPQSATGSQVTSNTYSIKPKLIVIVEPIYTVWTSTENDKINFGK